MMGTMMVYGLGMIPVIFFIWSVIPDPQTKTSVSKQDSYVMKIAAAEDSSRHTQLVLPPVTHYKGLVLAAHKGQKG